MTHQADLMSCPLAPHLWDATVSGHHCSRCLFVLPKGLSLIQGRLLAGSKGTDLKAARKQGPKMSLRMDTYSTEHVGGLIMSGRHSHCQALCICASIMGNIENTTSFLAFLPRQSLLTRIQLCGDQVECRLQKQPNPCTAREISN